MQAQRNATVEYLPGPSFEDQNRPSKDALIAEFSQIVGPFGRAVVEVAGELESLEQQTSQNTNTVAGVVSAVDTARSATTKVAESTKSTLAATKTAHETVDRSADRVSVAATESTNLANWAQAVGSRAEKLKAKVARVNKTAQEIGKIAEQINILAVNASIEAARAGAAGPGFAVIARAINELATTTQVTLQEIRGNLDELSEEAVELMEEGEAAKEKAMSVIGGADEISSAFETVRALIIQIDEETEAVVEDVENIDQSYSAVKSAVGQIQTTFTSSAASISEAGQRIWNIVDQSESLVALSAEMGGSSDDTMFIEHVRAAADEVGRQFEAGVASGEISQGALFDLTLTPIPGTDPVQYMAPFTKFLERVTPPIIAEAMDLDEKVVLCAPSARNGYLATNAPKVSQPQGPDTIWNAANCRNRRIFDDRVGLKTGNNTKPFLLQTYRRDMGDHFIIMKDVSAPIFVNGKHWGGLRIAYTF